MVDDINISDFILEKYTEAKVADQTLEVVFENETQFLGYENGQEKCKDLMFPFSRSPLKMVAIKHSKNLLESKNDSLHAKDITEITLDIKDLKEYEWQPGDTIAILPRNDKNSVDEFLQLLDMERQADTTCSVQISKLCTKKSAKVPVYIPKLTTPREILRDCLNIKSILKKTFIRSLAEHCTDGEEKTFLKCLSSKEGSAFYNELIMEKGFTVMDLLKHCRSCKPPFALIVEHLSRLLPRPYSIANSPLKSTYEISIIFSTLDVKPGVTTNMLKEKITEESASILMYLREPNYFRYTEDNYQQNQVLIAIGTGLAPFLGFLQHKQHMMANDKNGNPGITWLFVGTTSEQAVVHRDLLLQWQSKNILNNFVESYSRVPTTRYHYVQDSLECNAQQLVELLMKPETTIYLCADGGQISKSIEKSLQNILVKELAITAEESVEMMNDFKAKRKYREDIWL
ncbi:methionine synthase reductase [Calliphora vicina]|uniref:methionine synthase reductase n=1 Tax=Calliphora vicina TaxID=7373 RepID=UPI00325A53D8